MEGLIIRERIVGTDNMELHHLIRYCGAVACSDNWFLHKFVATCHGHKSPMQQSRSQRRSEIPLRCLLRYGWETLPPKKKKKEEVFERVTGADQMLTEQLQSSNLENKDKEKLLQRKLETVTYNALHLIFIFVKVRDIRKKESSGVFGLIQRFLSLNPRTQSGDTLLHLSVWYKTPTDDDCVAKVCKYPCAKTTKLIINAGGNVNVVNNEGNTPLHLAVSFKPSSVVCKCRGMSWGHC